MRKVLPVFLLLSVVLLAACGSDGDAATATPTAEPVDPNTLSDPQESLDAARALWAIGGGDDYDLNFNWQCFCVVDFVQRVDLEVRDNAISGGVTSAGGEVLTAEQLAEYQTVPELFDFIQDAIDRDAAEIRVSYASEGYPDEVWIDYDERMADEERGFFIHSLTLS